MQSRVAVMTSSEHSIHVACTATVHTHLSLHASTYVCIHAYSCIQTLHTCAHVCMPHRCVCIGVYTYICIHTYPQTHMPILAHADTAMVTTPSWCVLSYVYLYIFVLTCFCIYVPQSMDQHMCVCVCVHMCGDKGYENASKSSWKGSDLWLSNEVSAWEACICIKAPGSGPGSSASHPGS